MFFMVRLVACGKFQSTCAIIGPFCAPLIVSLVVPLVPSAAATPVTLMITVEPSGTFTLISRTLVNTDPGTWITFNVGSVPVIVNEENCAA
jgi:hypothetical protein